MLDVAANGASSMNPSTAARPRAELRSEDAVLHLAVHAARTTDDRLGGKVHQGRHCIGRPMPQPDPAMRVASTAIPTGTTPAEWRSIEHAATRELQRRTEAAHTAVIALLQTHAAAFSAKQRARIRRRLARGG
ncbi:hypothetical protein ACM9XB_08100 [Xanthomonas sacchari]